MRFALWMMIGLFLASPARAQDEPVRTIPFDGTEVFCHILQHESLQPLASVKDLMADPSHTLLIVFGSVGRTIPILDQWQQFESQGGNTLIATDREFALRFRPIKVTGKPVTQANLDLAYRHNGNCPLIRVAPGGGHPIFRLLREPIATNCPSALELGPAARRTVFALPYETHGQVQAPLCLAGSPRDAPPAGRSLFIAGHGLFMNGMMLQGDNDNFAFAINVVRWLREGPGGSTRSKALFLVDGAIITNYNANLTPPPIMPIPPIKAIDRLLHGLEKERFFHRVFDRIVGNDRDTLLSVLFAVVTLLLVLYGAKKLMEGRYLLETAAPRMVGAVPSLVPPAPAATQRPHALFRQANLANEATMLARAWFRQEFAIEPERWPLDAPMAFQVQGRIWGRATMQRQADRVLRLAGGADVAPMNRREFARLLRALPRLGDARRSGRLTLLAACETVR